MALVPFPSATPGDPLDNDESETLDDSSGKMSFLEHLDELRKRLIYVVYSLIVGCVIAFIFIGRIFDFIMKPMYLMLATDSGAGAKLMYTAGPEPFMLHIKIGFLAGIFIASPLILWQVWKFIAPGLYSHEKKFAIPFVLMSTLFFVAGGLFAHYVAFPVTWNFFKGFGNEYMVFMPKIDEAFSLYTKLILGMGAVFEMPTLVLFLARMGVVTARMLVKYFKYAFLGIFIIAAIISPGTDIPSQLVMAVPMILLYGVSIIVALIFQKRRKPLDD